MRRQDYYLFMSAMAVGLVFATVIATGFAAPSSRAIALDRHREAAAAPHCITGRPPLPWKMPAPVWSVSGPGRKSPGRHSKTLARQNALLKLSLARVLIHSMH